MHTDINIFTVFNILLIILTLILILNVFSIVYLETEQRAINNFFAIKINDTNISIQ